MRSNQHYTTPYEELKRKAVFDVLDKFPDHGNLTCAKIIYNNAPELFGDVEQARSFVRRYRGCLGVKNLKTLKNKKYVRKPV